MRFRCPRCRASQDKRPQEKILCICGHVFTVPDWLVLMRMEEVYIKPLEEEICKLQAANRRAQADLVSMKAIADHYEKLFWNLGVPRGTSRRRRIRGKEER